MSRPIPICHRTVHAALDPGQKFQMTTTGTRCVGSACAAWFSQREDGRPHQPLTGLGCCRDLNSSFVDADLWPDAAAPTDPSNPA